MNKSLRGRRGHDSTLISNHEDRHARNCSYCQLVQYHYVAEHVFAHDQALSVTIVSPSAAPISSIIELAMTSSSSDLLTLDILSFECITTYDYFCFGNKLLISPDKSRMRRSTRPVYSRPFFSLPGCTSPHRPRSEEVWEDDAFPLNAPQHATVEYQPQRRMQDERT
jgi:hypothetical protein